ncbi:DUF6498-containing protein [Pseudomarimonas salicorniae]|uniref:DUF6498-containing protein n=1 Tax=Pseudomarimonas salicorniae TaxID=2933270 RepID=A0ABT0GG17_9GAMM|nr:DUF6498-containing protein [Lysobacter sp. CAU 1642]MCK7593486.1 DUF6498-containing protein [Lysobacter sp. CAU 1642]
MLRDRATLGILASNLVTLGVAYWADWGLLALLWPYWIQSVVIGWFSYRRIRALRRFAVDNLRMNNQPVDESPDTRRRIAQFFALHYGFFHVGYLFFLGIFSLAGQSGAAQGDLVERFGTVSALDLPLIALLGLSFYFSHAASHREHLAADLRGRPNIGTLMFLPYGRVLPMHVTIIVGAALNSGLGLLLFGLLKTAADLGMHHVEHRVLQGGR